MTTLDPPGPASTRTARAAATVTSLLLLCLLAVPALPDVPRSAHDGLSLPVHLVLGPPGARGAGQDAGGLPPHECHHSPMHDPWYAPVQRPTHPEPAVETTAPARDSPHPPIASGPIDGPLPNRGVDLRARSAPNVLRVIRR